ncbi:hypothetical protein ABE28_016260 [Peribacillus muralis]|uniref:Uncharacterized protein n=1 Tax=Peribacillus muralis TaxID=264697 RepID=A0A1B3XRR1_9BACI|nr:hypothetical protein ABE28_016260 [Peribacillus muralis]
MNCYYFYHENLCIKMGIYDWINDLGTVMPFSDEKISVETIQEFPTSSTLALFSDVLFLLPPV